MPIALCGPIAIGQTPKRPRLTFRKGARGRAARRTVCVAASPGPHCHRVVLPGDSAAFSAAANSPGAAGFASIGPTTRPISARENPV